MKKLKLKRLKLKDIEKLTIEINEMILVDNINIYVNKYRSKEKLLNILKDKFSFGYFDKNNKLIALALVHILNIDKNNKKSLKVDMVLVDKKYHGMGLQSKLQKNIDKKMNKGDIIRTRIMPFNIISLNNVLKNGYILEKIIYMNKDFTKEMEVLEVEKEINKIEPIRLRHILVKIK